jgi:hypothetical protein
VTDEEIAATSEAVIVQFLNSTVADGVSTALIDDSVHSASMLILMSAICYLSSTMRCSTSTLDMEYGFPILFMYWISFSIFVTASPVASPAFSGYPLSSF